MSETKKAPEIMTLPEVARFLRVSVLTVKRWGRAGRIKFFRINKRGDRRFWRTDIMNYIDQTHEKIDA